MSQKYTDLDDLWSEWGEATSSIMKHVEENEPIDNKFGWNFEEGIVTNHHSNGYSVYIAYSAYDPLVNSSVRLHVQAFVSQDESIEVKTNKRELVETV